MITLNELKAGENAEILGIEADKDVKERLKMLGVFPGARVCFLKRAFFGQECLIRADFVRIGMRRNFAEKIFVVRIDKTETQGEAKA